MALVKAGVGWEAADEAVVMAAEVAMVAGATATAEVTVTAEVGSGAEVLVAAMAEVDLVVGGRADSAAVVETDLVVEDSAAEAVEAVEAAEMAAGDSESPSAKHTCIQPLVSTL